MKEVENNTIGNLITNLGTQILKTLHTVIYCYGRLFIARAGLTIAQLGIAYLLNKLIPNFQFTYRRYVIKSLLTFL